MSARDEHAPAERAAERAAIDYRAHPEQYRIGRGEQGIFHAHPYTDELLPLWTIRTVATATAAAEAIAGRFADYRAAGDFVGMDVARKFLQMGYTRARRYARYPGGRKHDPDGTLRQPAPVDAEKQAVADLYRAAWRAADDPTYQGLKREHQRRERRAG